MHGYSQPLDYKFSHDSVELAQRALAAVVRRDVTSPLRMLDLCAGCGVVGLEIARLNALERNPAQLEIDFVEVQPVYKSHFDQNVKWINSSARTRFIEMNYGEMRDDRFADNYDLVVSNPPYFDRDQGKLPPSDFKARCRFFLDSDFETLLSVIVHILKPGGLALILVRDLADHDRDRDAILDSLFLAHGSWRALDPVRGTRLIEFTKQA